MSVKVGCVLSSCYHLYQFEAKSEMVWWDGNLQHVLRNKANLLDHCQNNPTLIAFG